MSAACERPVDSRLVLYRCRCAVCQALDAKYPREGWQLALRLKPAERARA